MSELKAETIVPQGTTITLQMYPKAEADKVIAHNKYKRCVAMTMLCRSLACFYDTMRENGLYWVWKSDRTYKWYKRWLELAEEPTWARFLQLIRKETK